MTLRVERLTLAMAEHEGWHSLGSKLYPQGSRSYRHHNPGNLRSSPFADRILEGFAVFRNDSIGMLAFMWDIMQKAKGNTTTGLGPDSTIRDLIYKWAPPTDSNDTEAYLEDVVKTSGLSAKLTLKELLI